MKGAGYTGRLANFRSRRHLDQERRGSAGDAAIALHTQGGARIPLRGRTFLRKALLRPARSHSA
ncbi:MAG: hypothetical protein ABIO50_04140, partial [Nitrosospira sp.]